ncbi:MAG: chemotaxis protein CheW [Nitrospirae bacterium]|nr:chemotaxis protein CheW [Nitrospirota bacterium]
MTDRPISSAMVPGASKGGEDEAPPRAIFTFWLGDEEYGIELAAVKEIVKHKDLTVTRVPTAPPFIPGILSLRGEVIPMLDLKMRLGLGAEAGAESGTGGRIVICEHRGSSFGVIVDRVGGVVHVPESRLEKAPAHIGAAEAEFIERLGKYDAHERRRAGEFVPGEFSQEEAGEQGELEEMKIVAILHVPKIVDFGLEEEGEIDEAGG